MQEMVKKSLDGSTKSQKVETMEGVLCDKNMIGQLCTAGSMKAADRESGS